MHCRACSSRPNQCILRQVATWSAFSYRQEIRYDMIDVIILFFRPFSVILNVNKTVEGG